MRHGSLFSGYGGLDSAITEVFGATTAWVSDIDPGACRILAHRYPDAPNLGDITTTDWSRVEPVDIISGGSPCQDLSQAGRRAGMRPGTRSGLWESMREAVATLRPRYYAPAIHRHELALGRVAPSPMEVGPSGKPRLSAFAVEWMMCAPAGWVTGVPGLTRNQMLKALGNGVVPPQAATALRIMLDRMEAVA